MPGLHGSADIEGEPFDRAAVRRPLARNAGDFRRFRIRVASAWVMEKLTVDAASLSNPADSGVLPKPSQET